MKPSMFIQENPARSGSQGSGVAPYWGCLGQSWLYKASPLSQTLWGYWPVWKSRSAGPYSFRWPRVMC